MPLGLVAAQQAASRGGCAECLGRSLGFDEAIALGPYQGPLRLACLRLKHARDAWLARWLADLLIDARGEPIRAFVSRSERPPLVVPIPLHWWLRQRRRYNQAEELASRLAHRLGLRRARRNAPDLDGRDLILVDDILTTGATCGAAARALKARGAARVLAVVIGRAEGRS
jgi:predicted amidophosphoribosyltransferase